MHIIKSGNLAAWCSFAHIKSHDKSGDKKSQLLLPFLYFFGTAALFIDKICSSGNQSVFPFAWKWILLAIDLQADISECAESTIHVFGIY